MEILQSEFLYKYNIDESKYKKTGLNWPDLERIYDRHIKETPILESYLQSLSSKFSKLPQVHSIKYRVKDAEHLIEKIIRKKISDPSRNLSYENYFNELDDLVGIRILHLFKDEWEPIHDAITKYELKEQPKAYYRNGDDNMHLKEYEYKGCNLEVHAHGYRSIHYVITEDILSTKLSCEIQVRTIFEEAWSEIDHKICYPYNMKNPIFEQYLLMINRLAGSADEMGTFLIKLKEQLSQARYERDEEKAKLEKKIKDLQEEISMLKISKHEISTLHNKLDDLDSNAKGYLDKKLFITNPWSSHLNTLDEKLKIPSLSELQGWNDWCKDILPNHNSLTNIINFNSSDGLLNFKSLTEKNKDAMHPFTTGINFDHDLNFGNSKIKCENIADYFLKQNLSPAIKKQENNISSVDKEVKNN